MTTQSTSQLPTSQLPTLAFEERKEYKYIVIYIYIYYNIYKYIIFLSHYRRFLKWEVGKWEVGKLLCLELSFPEYG